MADNKAPQGLLGLLQYTPTTQPYPRVTPPSNRRPSTTPNSQDRGRPRRSDKDSRKHLYADGLTDGEDPEVPEVEDEEKENQRP
uniref:Protein E4 n=1 Tax=Human papillomavirus type 1 TaxID=10583 RepID=VE4_HPV1|nr:RecName: Full=Protein E4 [Human papillomavirus type 1a]